MAKTKVKNPRLGKVGGQAVIEGVMMKSGDHMAIASRLPNGKIKISRRSFVSARTKNKFLNFPLVRGVVSFVEMMKLSFQTMNVSTEALGIEDEEPSKFEKWLSKTFKVDIMDIVMFVGIVLGLALSVFLFIFLPTLGGSGISKLILWISGGSFDLKTHAVLYSVVEGVLKVAIFLLYLYLVSLMKDIRRVFEYHGAEHKSVFCYESGQELTVENVKKFKRFHPRCGTSFMFFMIIVGIIIGCFIPRFSGAGGSLLRALCKLALLPLTVGIGFEIIMYAGKHDNWFVRALSAPGLWVQRLTTKEPDDRQIECGIAALKAAIPEEFPVEPDETLAAKERAETGEVIIAEGGMKRVYAVDRRIKASQAEHERVKLRGMTAKQRAAYIRKYGR